MGRTRGGAGSGSSCRSLRRAEVRGAAGELETKRIVLDSTNTGDELQKLFAAEEVITVHSEEASLEDIFIQITGRKLL